MENADPGTDAKGMALGPGTKIWLNRIGALLGIAGVLFVALRLRSFAGEIDATRIGVAGYLGLALLVVIYGASNFLLANGWWRLLCHLGVSVPRGWAFRAYATSQLAKYVPGNIFQFAGRQAIGLAAGIGNRPLAKSTALELGFLAIGGALFVPLAAPLLMDWPTGYLVGLAAFSILSGLALRLVLWFGGGALAAAALSYLAFLIVSGAVFVAAYLIAGGSASLIALPAVSGAYVLAWLAGLLTPGAPAGIGVREAVLLFLLGSVGAPPVIIIAVVIGRAVTVLGDFGFYLVGGVLAECRST